MSPKLSLALFLCLIAASGSSFGAQSQCKFQNQKQQQDCLKQELANQQAQAQRQQQLQQQQAQQRQQQEVQRQTQLRQQQEAQRQQQLQQQRPVATTTPTKPTPAPQVVQPKPAPSKPTLSATPAASRTAGMTPVTLGNGQRVFVNSQGAYFDASGNPIANQSVSSATKGTPAITATPAPQVAPPKSAPPITSSGSSIGSANSRTLASDNGQQSTVQNQTVKSSPGSSASTPQTTPQVTPGSAGATGVGIGSAANRAQSVMGTLAANPASVTAPQIANDQKASQQPQKIVLPSTQELERYGVDQLAAMPREQLANLSADKRRHLDVYLSARADSAKYQAEANRSTASRVVEEFPRAVAGGARGAVEGGSAGVASSIEGTAAFARQAADPSTYQRAGSEVRALVTDPAARAQDAQILRNAGGAIVESGRQAAHQVADDISRGDARAAARDIAQPAARLITDVATGRVVARATQTVGEVSAGTSSSSRSNSFWSMANQPRGLIGEEIVLGRKPNLSSRAPRFPVLDDITPAGKATSIKTMDLRAKTYTDDPSTIRYALTGYAKDLAEFKRARIGAVEVSEADIKSRQLLLGVPPGGGTSAQKAALQQAIAEIKQRYPTVEVIIKEIP